MSRLPALVVCLAMAVTVAAPVAKARDVADAAPVASGVADVAKTEPAEEATADAATRRATAFVPPPPTGVRFGEPLEDGERFRLSYRFARVKSQGLLVADRDIRPGQVRSQLFLPYVRTPRSLEVTVHRFRVEYAPHPRVTLVADLPFVKKELERMDATDRFQDQTEGVGDLGFAVVVPFIRKGRESSHVHVGFDVPTGAIRRGGAGEPLPYDSQIGNGTWDLEWGWTYRGAWQRFAWGAQAVGHHPVRRNGRHYREGSRFEGSLWGAARLFAGLSSSVRVEWEKQNNIRGRDAGLDPIDDPAENPKARGGTRFAIAPGLALELPQLASQRVSVELELPVHQDLDGPQLERDWTLEVAWQWAF
ncbi:MAG: hypothetical protein H6748_05880 [Spirochaetaceae bacterium]|nr:hypothetical protein [Myxococcales bacterium]MCB9723555.1 hypothetical protein [Spirochaetaceae bacterium]